jgi:hypothetical protein
MGRVDKDSLFHVWLNLWSSALLLMMTLNKSLILLASGYQKKLWQIL